MADQSNTSDILGLLNPMPLANYLWQHKGLLNPLPLINAVGDIGRQGGAHLADMIAGQDTTPFQYTPKTDEEKQAEHARLHYNAMRGADMYAEGLAKGSDMAFWDQARRDRQVFINQTLQQNQALANQLGPLMQPQPRPLISPPPPAGTK
jgi:hypothetical protein